jgi:iron complex transport system permease protein
MYLRKHHIFILIVLTWLLWLTVMFSASLIGPGTSGPTISWPWNNTNILELRVTRIIAAGAVGAALSSAGVLLQALLRNPLADATVLGIAGGAAVGVTGFTLYGPAVLSSMLSISVLNSWQPWGTPVFALLGAFAAAGAVFWLTRQQRGGPAMDPLTLLLTGVIVNACCAALLVFMNALAPDANKRLELSLYMMGHLQDGLSTQSVLIAAIATGLIWLTTLRFAGAFNIATLRSSEATALGINLPGIRLLMFIGATILAALAVTLAGPIAFVGLICPHLLRLVLGSDQRQLLLLAPPMGGILLVVADSFVRATGVWFNGDLPVGALTALLGGPFFLLLLRRGEYRHG